MSLLSLNYIWKRVNKKVTHRKDDFRVMGAMKKMRKTMFWAVTDGE